MNSELPFIRQVALVTGAASGIGRATALAFARAGTKVVVSDWNEKGGSETAHALQALGAESVFIPCDVSQPTQVQSLFERAIQKFGRIDHAFNNAGTEGKTAPLHESTTENWNQTLGINLSGVYWCMREEIPVMLRQGGGTIINCASIAGVRGFAGMAAYTASKHGVIGLTRSAALDYAHQNIRINALCPGVIHTPMIDRFTQGDAAAAQQLASGAPIGRMGKPEEIADAVLWLCNPNAAFVIGTEIIVDGGWCSK